MCSEIGQIVYEVKHYVFYTQSLVTSIRRSMHNTGPGTCSGILVFPDAALEDDEEDSVCVCVQT